MRVTRGVVVLTTLMLALLFGGGPVSYADLNNNGLDEMLVFGQEVDGLARGNFYQVWDGAGTSVASKISVLNGYVGLQFFVADVIAGAGNELVDFGYRQSDGSTKIEVRNAAGTVLASNMITGPGFTRHRIFPVDIATFAGTEIGIGFQRSTDGMAFFQVWRRNGATLTQVQGQAMVGAGHGRYSWGAADFNGDGSDDIFLGFQKNSNGAAAIKVWNVITNSQLVSRFIIGAGFDDFQWVLGNFFPTTTGVEVAAGFVRQSNGAAAFQVWDEVSSSPLVARFIVGPGFGEYDWRALNTGSDLNPELFVGFIRNSNRAAAFQVHDPNGAVTPAGSAFTTGSAYTPGGWDVGQFDGNVADGEEILYGFTRDSNGAIGYQVWNWNGTSGGGAFVLGPGYGAPEFRSVRGWNAARDDVMIVARNDSASGAPILLGYNMAGTRLFGRFVLNGDVKGNPRPADS